MDKKTYLLIWLASLLVVGAAASLFAQPGYMDAFYYYHVAANLAAGRGLVEEFVWNYLAPPPVIPHPSNLYWMPLTSLISAPVMALLGPSFRAAQMPLVLIASLVPPVTALVVWDLWRDRELAKAAAFLTLFGGFYLLDWTTIDSFGVFLVAATVSLWSSARYLSRRNPPSLEARTGELSGVVPMVSPSRGHPGGRNGRGLVAPVETIAGVLPGSQAGSHIPGTKEVWLLGLATGAGAAAAHLARVDGSLVLVPGLAGFLLSGRPGWRLPLVLALATYVLLMGPWSLRVWSLTASLASPGALATMFFREYNDLFAYSQVPTLAGYLSWGLGPILASKLRAFGENLVVLYGSGWMLLPFGLLGAWQMRRDPRLVPFFLYTGLLYILLTLVFTFPGARGSMRHSGVALLPWTSVLAVQGIRSAVGWSAARLPHWDARRAQRGFTLVAIAASACLSLAILVLNTGSWDDGFRRSQELAGWLDQRRAGLEPVMVTDPPGLFYASGRRAVATPSNGVEALVAAADAYGVEYVALEREHAPALDRLYAEGEQPQRLETLGWVGSTLLFRVRR